MANTHASITFLQLTDLHILPGSEDTLLGVNTYRYFQKILRHAFSDRGSFDLILITGDLAQEPSEQSYRQILDGLKGFDVPVVCLPGNHDDFVLMQRMFKHDMINCRKQHIFSKWQLICLNSQIPGSAKGNLAASELNFLRRCLQEKPDLHALVAMHHHCLATHSAWMDTMIIKNNTELLDLLTEFPGVKAIVTGHIHQVMDKYYHTIRVLSTPSTCFQFKPESKHFAVDSTSPGYRIIKLYDDGRFETCVKRLPEPLEGLNASSHGY
jgi:Icc protein